MRTDVQIARAPGTLGLHLWVPARDDYWLTAYRLPLCGGVEAWPEASLIRDTGDLCPECWRQREASDAE